MKSRRMPAGPVSQRSVLLAVIAAMLLAIPNTTAAQEREELPTELIKVTNVSLNSAYALSEGVCQAAVRNNEECGGIRTLVAESMLAVTATRNVITQIQALLAEFDRVPETRTFQIVVLSADRSGATASGVPENVQQALDDVRGFLPYTGFRVLGSGWLRTSRQAETTLPGTMDLTAQLEFRPSSDPAEPLFIEEFGVYRRIPVEMIVDGQWTIQDRNQVMIQSTFTISPGETVVVGTSKLDGDDTAMVVLLTAVQN